ncbi:hypothetical protein [Macrococcus equipercicus]|uniref:Uncharacterized protein n=1 Tax=Macrococcus equipercicus TaxID=69967 RepID=A0A9Q9F2B2_9STAP|nr:hypothetical protein [Macrococcus equipercicus]KAA1035780.1 hypothetical protein ERX35_011030 [Macrococcus equipercicus]UTH14953.1 hypothetical protein KFV11_11555 [Macrococcus equipercicus]
MDLYLYFSLTRREIERNEKNYRIYYATTLLLGGFTSTTLASEIKVSNNTNDVVNDAVKNEMTIVSEELINKANPFISVDDTNDKFILDKESARNTLTENEVELVQKQLNKTNHLLHEENVNYVQHGESLIPENNAKVEKSITTYSTSEGINKVEFYWWGAKIWISKTAVRKVLETGAEGGGAALGAYLGGVPGALLGTIAGSLVSKFGGPAAARAVYIKYNYALGIQDFQIFNK